MLPRCRAAAAHPASPMPLRPPARLRRRSPVSQRAVRLRVVVRVHRRRSTLHRSRVLRCALRVA